MMTDLPKLVRDRIPKIISDSGRSCTYKTAKGGEVRSFLFKKLYEEIEEFRTDPGVPEAIDIYEVFLALLQHYDVDYGRVYMEADLKRLERGGFERGIILESISE